MSSEQNEEAEVVIETDKADQTEPMDHTGDHGVGSIKNEDAESMWAGAHGDSGEIDEDNQAMDVDEKANFTSGIAVYTNETGASEPSKNIKATPDDATVTENSRIYVKDETVDHVDEQWDIPESSHVSIAAFVGENSESSGVNIEESVEETEDTTVSIPHDGETEICDQSEVTNGPSDLEVDSSFDSGNGWNDRTKEQNKTNDLDLDVNKDTGQEVQEAVNAFANEHSVDMETEELKIDNPEKSVIHSDESNEVVKATHKPDLDNVTTPKESIAFSDMSSDIDDNAVVAVEDALPTEEAAPAVTDVTEDKADDTAEVTEDHDAVKEVSYDPSEPTEVVDSGAYTTDLRDEVEDVTDLVADSDMILKGTDATEDIAESVTFVEADIATEQPETASVADTGVEATDSAEEAPKAAAEPEDVAEETQVTAESTDITGETDVLKVSGATEMSESLSEDVPNRTKLDSKPPEEAGKGEEISNQTGIIEEVNKPKEDAELTETEAVQDDLEQNNVTEKKEQQEAGPDLPLEYETEETNKPSSDNGAIIETNGISTSVNNETLGENSDVESAITSLKEVDVDKHQLTNSSLETENAKSENSGTDIDQNTSQVSAEEKLQVKYDDLVKPGSANDALTSLENENSDVTLVSKEGEKSKDSKTNVDKMNDNEQEKMEVVNDVEVPPSEKNKMDDTDNSNDVTEGMEVVENSMDQMDESSNISAEYGKREDSSSSDFSSVSVKQEKMHEEKSKDPQSSAATASSKGDNSDSLKEDNSGSLKGDDASSLKGDNSSSLNSDDKLSTESTNSQSLTNSESLKETPASKEVANQTIKQEKKDKEEDDDVIAIKEEKKPPPKMPKSKMQKCIVCAKFGKCKYNIVRNGDIKHLCDDECFKRFRSSPTTYLRQVEVSATPSPGDKPKTQAAQPVTPASAATASEKLAAKLNEKAAMQQPQKDYKTCSVCQLINVRTAKPFLNWQGMDYCSEECLGKFQAGLSSTCSNCSTAIFQRNKTKYICNIGSELKHFCSETCHTEFLKKKFCAYCSKDLSTSKNSFMAAVDDMGHFKDFCSQSCLQYFEIKNKKGGELTEATKWKFLKPPTINHSCAVCQRVAPPKHCLKLDSKLSHLCSDPCLSAFKYANKIELSCCDQCGSSLNGEAASSQIVQYEGQQKRFCSFMCVNLFRQLNLKRVQCAWCSTKKNNFDMIERVDASNRFQLFCSLNCLSLYRVNLQATSNQNVVCDQCRKFVPAQYHLTMSDASVRNFCSYTCVMTFQQQFQNPVKPSTPQQPPPTPQQQQQKTPQQQTVTRSGRVVSNKGIKSTQQNMPPARNNMKTANTNTAESFPVISNVISLAPLQVSAQQPDMNMKTPPAAPPSNQIPGVKKTTTVIGSQPVQQQIIIQPPPPKPMKNKALLCKPITMTKATSCRPHTQTKEVQTDKSEPDWYFIPVPVPIYCPTPLSMYSLPTPIMIPVPVPVPVPVFIPTTKKSANSILKQIKDIREKIPADPLEAELLMMADMVAGKEESSGTSSSEEEELEELEAPSKVIKDVAPTPGPSGASGADLGEDMLQMALRMATEMSEEPAMDLENSLEPVAVNTAPPPQPMQAQVEDEDEDEEYIPASTRSRRSRGSAPKRQSHSTPRRTSKRQKVDAQPQYKEPSPSPPPQPVAPPPDINFHLKYTYGVNAFKHWVLQKNTQLEQASKTGYGKMLKTFKSDILQCTADELNYSLCLFVKEVRKPNGEEYAVDSIYYLCLGLQQYLFESGRIDNIFGDYYYERFTECLNELLTKYEPKLNHTGQLVCRIEEEHLWESKQLGAHSPHVLLNSLVYFNTKYFMLKTSEDHLRLSFTHIMKHWKKTPSGRGSGTGPNSGRSVYLRYYCPTPQGKDMQQQKKKKEEMPVYEQTENFDNPLRCPVKLYEFYLSKCPESIKNRNDTFYLVPERSCVPDSPVWYSTTTLGVDHMAKMLNRIRLVREIQEAHLHTQPIFV